MRKRGAALGWHFYLLAGGVAPRFFTLCLFRTRPFCASAFLPFCLCPRAPTRTHVPSRIPRGSHATPIARFSSAYPTPTLPKIENNENLGASST